MFAQVECFPVTKIHKMSFIILCKYNNLIIKQETKQTIKMLNFMTNKNSIYILYQNLKEQWTEVANVSRMYSLTHSIY